MRELHLLYVLIFPRGLAWARMLKSDGPSLGGAPRAGHCAALDLAASEPMSMQGSLAIVLGAV